MRGRGDSAQATKTWAKRLAIIAIATIPSSLLIFASPFIDKAFAAGDVRTASLTSANQPAKDVQEAPIPQVLRLGDLDRYRRIFALQDHRQWAAADHEISQLGDKVLLGIVLAQRYRDRHYIASYRELAAWLDRYGDQPDAKRLYALALSRQPRGAKPPAKPTSGAPDDSDLGARQADAATSSKAEALARQIRLLAGTEPMQAQALLGGADARRLLDGTTRAELDGVVTDAVRGLGKVQVASLARKSSLPAPATHWNAGLAAWRLGRFGEAGQHFQALARSPGQSSWTKSAAAFWSARVALRSRQPERVAYWLGIAAEHPRTFYGLIARRLLGVDTYLNFDTDPFTRLDARLVLGNDAGRRALALIAIGQRGLASTELHDLATRAGPSLLGALEALADRANLPSLSLQLAAMLADNDGRNHDYALYPMPRWSPLGGFSVDRALLFALMRQESLFLPRVESSAGAFGLMQLMPATAHSMAIRTGVSLAYGGRPTSERAALADPELNLTLAQEYVQLLLDDEHIKDNLLLFACAYNSGPTAVLRWQSARNDYRNDPLLFLESIPAEESRAFTKRVLTNYSIYRQRLGQPVPDLDALAAGDWPIYTALDNPPEQERRDASNR